MTASESEAAYLSPGWLLWIRDGALVTQQIDTSEWKLANDQVTLAHRVAWDPNGEGGFTVSESGLVAYRSGAGEGRRQLAWFDRAGIQIGTVAGPDANFVQNPVVSPDGRRVAGARTVQGNTDVWVMDGTRISRFTFDAAVDNFPIWSPDGSRIVFRSDRTGVRNLFVKPSGGIGEEEILVDSADDKTASNWSADGRFIFFMSTVSSGTRDVWVVPLQGDRTPRPFLQTSFDERHGQFSPDGRWVAYISNESGRDEIHVRPFTEPGQAASGGGQWQVSTGGGIHPLWRADGRELYYLAPDGTLMAVPVQVTGTAIEPGAPVALFQTRIVGGGVDAGQGRQYDVARDGRFLINTIVDDEVVSPITVLQNWRPPDAP